MSTVNLTAQIERATNRLAKLKAREMLKEAHAQAKARSAARREDAHRKITLGGLVIAAGAADLDPAVLVGLLLRDLAALAHPAGDALAAQFREQGIAHLQAREAARATR